MTQESDQPPDPASPHPAGHAQPDAAPGTPGGGGQRVVLVTGMSGAGRSTTLKALEDVGYEAIDNLPLHLVATIVHEGGLDSPVAIGVDIRTRNFAVQPFLDALQRLESDPKLAVTLLFVDCEEEVLRRRFTETRRRHPLAQGRPLTDGIAAERRLVAPLRQRADMTIDTSTLSTQDLRRVISAQLGLAEAQGMAVFVTSFSYKNGLPREADLVFDVRFLRNPHYDPELKPLTGRDAAVADYVAADPDFAPFFGGLVRLLKRLLPRYEREGKSYLTIAIGCTGGRHRSVALAEKLAVELRRAGRSVTLSHRELGVGGDAETAAPAPNAPAADTSAPGSPAPGSPAPDSPAPDSPAPDSPAPDSPAPDSPAPGSPAHEATAADPGTRST
jgi:UPF0042 nucleotide-binding protein